jgi:hypothetical protein
MLCLPHSKGIALAWMSSFQPIKLQSIYFAAVDCERFTTAGDLVGIPIVLLFQTVILSVFDS